MRQAALPMRPGGDQHPKRNHTYTVIAYNKWLVNISMFPDSIVVYILGATSQLFVVYWCFNKQGYVCL